MLNLPESTVYGKKILKQKFYDHPSMTPTLKRIFIDQIQQIYWKNKISPFTVNLGIGNSVSEIEIIYLKLSQKSLDKKALQLIDKAIPYHILFLLEFDDKVQAWISFKEGNSSKTGTLKAGTYYCTEWMKPDELTLHLDGLNMDSVYENFVYQIAGARLEKENSDSLKDAVSLDGKRQKLLKEIAALEKKIQKEKQFNRQIEFFNQLKLLKKELEDL